MAAGGDKVRGRWAAAFAASALVLVLGLLWALGAFAFLADQQRIQETIAGLGAAGPVALVMIEALAIVVSPLPSAPVAVAAGAAYGPVLGTILVVIGAEIGSIAAFLIARAVGEAVIRPRLPAGGFLARLESERSQTWLMLLVFGSRLVPFLSFDAVSYVAGLTPLAFWRFAVATLAGVVPIAFLLAYAGAEALDASPTAVAVLLGVLVLTGAIPFALAAARRLAGRDRGDAAGTARLRGTFKPHPERHGREP